MPVRLSASAAASPRRRIIQPSLLELLGGGRRSRQRLAARVAEHLRVEGVHAGRLPRIAEAGQSEVVLDPAQQAVVVVGVLGDRARGYAGRERHRADLASPGPRDRATRVDRVVAGLLVAAGAGVRAAFARVTLGLVEGDQQQAVVLEGRGARDPWDPLLEEGIRLDHSAGLPVGAGLVVPVVAEIREMNE